MGGPRVDPEVKRLVEETWLNRIKKSDRVLAKEVFDSVRYYLHLKNKDNIPLPQLRTIQKILQELRAEYLARTDDQAQQDNPWTTESCSDYTSDFPPDTIPFLLELWRYSVHIREVFTIRQAIWAARLSYLLKDMDIAEIWVRTLRYSQEQVLSILTDRKMRTFQLDASLVMDDWERETVDVNNDLPYEDIHHTPINRARDNGIMEEYINVLSDYGPSETLEQYNKLKRLYYLIVELPSPCNYFDDIETRLIYLSHLTYISKIPKWKTLSPEEIREIIVDLRKWVLDVKTNPEKFENPSKTSAPHIVDLNQDPTLVPTHIYERLEWSREGED